MATGRTDGAYYALAQLFKAELAKEDIELNIIETNGSIENVELLSANSAQVGFVQSGVVDGDKHPMLQGLGSLYFEPLWVFVRHDSGITQLNQLTGATVAIGQTGSGTRAVALAILQDNRLIGENIASFDLSGMDAVNAFE